jgi:hypothetical protein
MIVGIVLMARIVTDKKLKLIYEIFDDDNDGCLSATQILKMLQTIQRIYQNASLIENKGSVVDPSYINMLADKKVEGYFYFLLGKIKYFYPLKTISISLDDESVINTIESKRQSPKLYTA